MDPSERGSILNARLMHAAFIYGTDRGANRFVGMGRRALLPMYRRIGFCGTGIPVESGAVGYEVMTCITDDAATAMRRGRRAA